MSVCQECLNDKKNFFEKVFLEMDYEKDYDLRFGKFLSCSLLIGDQNAGEFSSLVMERTE